jgi:DMSO/TMAO reductase YedYZ molybdopterin-dependent catalytic subunit
MSLEKPGGVVGFDRRAFLRRAGASALPLISAGGLQHLVGTAQAQENGGLILREKEPLNLEFPFAKLDGFNVPNELFYVRTHFPVPKLEPASWRFKLEGAVNKPLTLALDELRKMASRNEDALLECTGNGRSFLTPKTKGVQWQLGAVGTARWTGVPLGAVLERSGLKDSAVEVILEGADSGTIKDPPKPEGAIHFARSLPLAKARKADVLLAYGMNGKDLPVNHGFPLRLIVPGWYGMASVKWLTRLIVTDRPFNGFFQSIDYSFFERVNGLPSVAPIQEIQVKASVARPAQGETVPAGKTYRVHGAAWTGESAVAKVEVSTNGGRSWAAARLVGKPVPYCWRLWEYEWRTPQQPGRYAIMARATDARGRIQPLRRDPDRRNYMINHVVPIGVDVK